MTQKRREGLIAAGITLLAILFVGAVVAALAAAGNAATASGNPRSCWQVKMTFYNYPSYPHSFARWRVEQGKVRVPGYEFSFKGDAGGGYGRTASFCTRKLNPERTVKARLWVTLFVPCPDCRQFIAIRRKP